MAASGIRDRNWPRQHRRRPHRWTVVVPARDEAPVIAQTLGSLLRQDYAGPLRIILVDDGSSDGTGAIARRLAAGHARQLDIIEGKACPPGWSGKLWAVAQGLAQADTGEFILLTDADITHDPRHVATLIAQASGSMWIWCLRWSPWLVKRPPNARWCQRSSTSSSCCTLCPGKRSDASHSGRGGRHHPDPQAGLAADRRN